MMTQKIVYQPLKSETLRHFAREVGTKLAEQQNDGRYADPEIIDGLADFLKIVSDMLIAKLNRQSDQGVA